MKSRVDLHDRLVSILGSNQVYFQPPSNVQMKYPAIVYELSGDYSAKADNRRYTVYDKYTITHIFKSLNNEKKNEILDAFKYVEYDRRLIADGLYQDIYTIYW
jgi:hypothetical protein